MKLKKLLCTILSVLMLFTGISVAGCGGPGIDIDETKTQVYIGNQNYGFGDAWLISAIDKFEKRYANTPFEDGKTGVQVLYENGSDFTGLSLLQTIKGNDIDIYFSDGSTYYEYINSGAMMDITDIVTEPLTEFGETKSIADKLINCFSTYLDTTYDFNTKTHGAGKYYALPNYECVYQVNYNVKYFEDNNLYYGLDGELGQNGSDRSQLSAGPDGEYGNYDDGQPATFEEFFALCEHITKIGGVPVTWPGGAASYRNVYVNQFKNSIEREESELLANPVGKATRLIKVEREGSYSAMQFDENGYPILEELDLTYENGYNVYRQSGWYWATKFFEEILENEYHNSGAIGGRTHMDTQKDFINSTLGTNQPIAILLEGNYWINEAAPSFEYAHTNLGAPTREESKYGVMAFPKPTDQDEYQGPNSYSVGTNALSFISAYTPENRLGAAKKFLQFLFTDEMLFDYTKIVGATRGCEVNFTETQLASLPYYARTMIEYRKDAVVVGGSANTAFYKENPNITKWTDLPESYIKDGREIDAVLYLRNQTIKSLQDYDHAAIYFNGIQDGTNVKNWASTYSKYWS